MDERGTVLITVTAPHLAAPNSCYWCFSIYNLYCSLPKMCGVLTSAVCLTNTARRFKGMKHVFTIWLVGCLLPACIRLFWLLRGDTALNYKLKTDFLPRGPYNLIVVIPLEETIILSFSDSSEVYFGWWTEEISISFSCILWVLTLTRVAALQFA